MNTSHYLVSVLVMSLYSSPVLILLGLVGLWLAGTAGAAIGVGAFILALLLGLSPKRRSVSAG